MKPENTPVSSYDAKIQKVEAIVSQFNQAQKIQKVDEGSFRSKLEALGATTNEALSYLTVEDLFHGPNPTSLPPVLARQIVAILKEKSEDKGQEKPAWISARMVDRMRYDQLLAHYDPDDANPVSRKLTDLSKGEPCIVFLPTGGVDQETSCMLLLEIRKGYSGRPNGIVQVGTSFRKIHKVGENPDRVFEENPLYKGRALRPDGTCDQLNRSWNDVSMEIRQLFWLAINETQEFGLVNIDRAHQALDLALTKAVSLIKVRYPQAAAMLEEKTEEGAAPTLKIKAGKASKPTNIENGNNSPFGIGKDA